MVKKSEVEDFGEAAGSDDYDDLLNRSWDDMPEEQLLPSGTWQLKVRNATYLAPKDDKSGRVLFFYTPVTPLGDVDIEAISALGADYDLTANQVTFQLWIESSRDWKALRKHAEMHGIDVAGKTPKETFKALRGAAINAFVDTRSYQNKAGMTVTENVATGFSPIDA